MKVFVIRAAILICLLFAGLVFAGLAPAYGRYIGLALTLIALVALYRPLPQLHLQSRAFSAALALLVGAPVTLASFAVIAEENRLAELRMSDTAAYLSELERRKSPKWMDELKILDPEQYAAEQARLEIEEAERQNAIAEKNKELAAAEAERMAVAERKAAALRAAQAEKAALAKAERAAKAKAERQAKLDAYIAQLDREIASIPSINVRDYTAEMEDITAGLLLLGAWALIYEDGNKFSLSDEAKAKRNTFKNLAVAKQKQLLPVMRDAYGPVMRQRLWEADSSARTVGSGYRTVQFTSATFARNANIKKVHLEWRNSLMMLRFTRAEYKWIKFASEYSFYTMTPPDDSELIIWNGRGGFRPAT